jgi:hypothetical protein
MISPNSYLRNIWKAGVLLFQKGVAKSYQYPMKQVVFRLAYYVLLTEVCFLKIAVLPEAIPTQPSVVLFCMFLPYCEFLSIDRTSLIIISLGYCTYESPEPLRFYCRINFVTLVNSYGIVIPVDFQNSRVCCVRGHAIIF